MKILEKLIPLATNAMPQSLPLYPFVHAYRLMNHECAVSATPEK